MLFTSLMDIFRPFIMKEYKQWHKRLLMDWMAKGVDDKKVGEQTLRALLLSVANQLVGMSQNDAIPILKVINFFCILLYKSYLQQKSYEL